MDSYTVVEYLGVEYEVGSRIKLTVDPGDLIAILSLHPPTLKVNSTALVVTPEEYNHVVRHSETVGCLTLSEYNVQLQRHLEKKHKSALLSDKYSLAGIMERGVKINCNK